MTPSMAKKPMANLWRLPVICKHHSTSINNNALDQSKAFFFWRTVSRMIALDPPEY